MDETLRALVEAKEEKRARFLQVLYGATQGDPRAHIEVDRVGPAIGLDPQEAREVARGLRRDELLLIDGTGWPIRITPHGARVVE